MLRQKITDGEIVLGTMISEIGYPNYTSYYEKMAGFEFVIIDGEHGPFDLTQFGSYGSFGKTV